jgi:HEAT repeat protein
VPTSIALLLVPTLLMIPPTDEQIEVRRQRVDEIQRLARADTPKEISKLVGLVAANRPVWERVTALKSLDARHRAEALPIVQRLAARGEDPVAIAAAVQSYRWDPTNDALRHLMRLRDKGASLRRAFWTGDDRGRPIYREKVSIPYLLSCLDSPTLHTRLDGALGLVEINNPAHRDTGLKVLRKAMSSTDAKIRQVAIRYIIVPFDDASLDGMLEAARDDPDPVVRSTAVQIQKR